MLKSTFEMQKNASYSAFIRNVEPHYDAGGMLASYDETYPHYTLLINGTEYGSTLGQDDTVTLTYALAYCPPEE